MRLVDVDAPPVRFASTDAGAVAWHEVGDRRAPTLVLSPPLAQHIEMMWEKPAYWRPIMRLAQRVHYIQYDKLGTGLSDPVDAPLNIDQRVANLIAVLDDAGIESATVLGLSEGGATAIAAAARHPDRVRALLLANAFAGASDLAGVAEHGPLPAAADIIDFWDRFASRWGTPDTLTPIDLAPSLLADEGMRQWLPRYERAAASPALIGRWVESALTIDVIDEIDHLHLPTLVVHLRGDRVVPVAHGRYLAARIEGARLVEFAGDDHFLWFAPDVDDYIDVMLDFLKSLGLANARMSRAGRVRDAWDPFETLTPGERRCARLAQRGLTNAEIAATLGLSVRTVENHLSRAFSKLGVRSRVQLALLGEDD